MFWTESDDLRDKLKIPGGSRRVLFDEAEELS